MPAVSRTNSMPRRLQVAAGLLICVAGAASLIGQAVQVVH